MPQPPSRTTAEQTSALSASMRSWHDIGGILVNHGHRPTFGASRATFSGTARSSTRCSRTSWRMSSSTPRDEERGDAAGGRLRAPPNTADRARRRHRQLRPMRAARGRRRARHDRARPHRMAPKPGIVRVEAGAKHERHRRGDAAERLRAAHAPLDQALGARSAALSRAAPAASAPSPMAACASPATSWPRASSRSKRSRGCIELRGDAAQKINRAYGTTGIITVLEMPLAPGHAVDRRDRRLRRFHGRRCTAAAAIATGRRHHQEAVVADRLAVAGKLRRASDALPRRARACCSE